MQQRLPSLLDPPVTFAHRGASAHAPENTLDAFGLALRLGATGLESDVWLTADGEPVLDHDGLVRRRLGRSVPIGEVRRCDLPPHVPTLCELLDTCGTGYHLSLDVRAPHAGRRVIDVVAGIDAGLLPRMWLCSPSRDALVPLRGLGARLIDSTRLHRIKEGPERRAASLAADGIDGINLHHADWTGGLVALFHRFDRVAFGWDLQQTHLLEGAMRMGLDAVYSDYPDRMADAYRAQIGAL